VPDLIKFCFIISENEEEDRQTDGHAVHLVHETALHHMGRDACVGSA